MPIFSIQDGFLFICWMVCEPVSNSHLIAYFIGSLSQSAIVFLVSQEGDNIIVLDVPEIDWWQWGVGESEENLQTSLTSVEWGEEGGYDGGVRIAQFQKQVQSVPCGVLKSQSSIVRVLQFTEMGLP
jgi:hypothetical protein